MAASLRDPHLRAPLVSQEEAAAIDAQGMSTLRRGYEAGRIGTNINARLAEESALRAAGDVAAADALRTNLAPRQLRQGIYAPPVSQVEQIGGAGDAASWFAGQVGQGFASMQDPLLASAAVGAVGTGLGFVPNPIAKTAGWVLRNAAAPVAGYDITRTQLKGEQYGNLSDDPTVMSRFSPQEIDAQASTYGNVAGLMDTLLPGMVGRQIGGAALRGAARPLLAPVPKAALGVVGEGATELGQGELGRYMHAGLNPERDAAGDASARLNEALGGAAGGAGIAGIGAGAEALYRAGRQVPGAVTDAAGSVVGLAEDGLAKAKGFGKGKPVPLGDDLRAASAEKDDARLADAQLLRGEPPADLDVNDPAAFDQWFHQSFPQRRERVRQGLQELAGQGDQEAGSLLAGLDSQDNAEVDNAMTTGAERIMDAQGLKDLLAEAESREAARKAPAARVGDALGKGLGRMGRQAAAAGKAAWDGATGGRKLNAQAPWTSDEFESRRREALSAFDEAADVSKRRQTGELLSEYLAEQARARASRFGSEDNARRVTGLMRETGRQVADLAANWNHGDRTAGERFDRLRYDLGRVADRMVGAYGDRSIEVAQRLEKLAGPEAAPVFKHLLEEIEQARQQGTARRAAQREQTAFDTLSQGIDPQRRAELLRNGVDLDAPRVRSKMLRLVEAAAEGTLPPAQRQELVSLVGQENLQRVMDSFVPATAEGEAQTMLEEAYTKPARDADGNVLTSEDTAGSDETETSDFEARQAEKLVQGRTGASLYGFYGMNNVRTDRTLGGKMRDPTAFSKDHRPRLLDLRVAAGQDAAATPETLAARTEAIEKTKARLRKHLGIDENDAGAGEWNIEVRSLLDDMARRDGVSLQTVLGPLAGRNEATNTDAVVAGVTAQRQTAAAGLKERVSGALPGQRSADMLDQIAASTGRSVGEPRSDADAQSERLGIDPTFVNKVITRYRDFMRSELERAQNSDKEGAAARVKAFEARVKAATAVLEDRRRQANSLRDPAGKQPELQTTAEQREKLTRMAVTYLKNFGVVVAERGTNADLETLTADQVLQLAASGDKLHKALDASADKNDLIVFESKLAPAKKDGSPGLLRMRGRDLVALSKKAAQEMTAPVEGAEQPKAKSPQQTWLDHLSNGIAIVVASGQVAGLPRGFENGKIPDHIPLPPTKDGKPMTAGSLRRMAEKRADTIKQEFAVSGEPRPLSKYSKEAGTPKAEAAVAKDQAGGREIMSGDAVRRSSDERSTRADIVPSERPADKAGRDYDEALGHIIENRVRPGNTGPLQRSKKDLDAISTAAVEVARLKARRAKLIEGGVSTKAPSIEKIDARVEELQAAIDAATIPAAAKEDAAPAGKSQSRPSGAADWTPGGRKLNAQATQLHNELKRPGFAATHDSPIRHDGRFDWRRHALKGEGAMAFGAGTYLSTGDGVHRYYKQAFTNAVIEERNKAFMAESDEGYTRPRNGFKAGTSPTYQVSVDIPPEQIMDWDKPLSEQSVAVQTVLKKLAAEKPEPPPRKPFKWNNKQHDAIPSLGLKEKMGTFQYGDDYFYLERNTAGRAYIKQVGAPGTVGSVDGSSAAEVMKAVEAFMHSGGREAAKYKNPFNYLIESSARGADWYRELTKKLGSQTAASDYLQSLGILGHVYAAANGSNGKTPNYVIYDDSKITTNFVAFNRQDQGLNATPQEISEARLWLAKVLPDVRL
jgi:hypothetical protein